MVHAHINTLYGTTVQVIHGSLPLPLSTAPIFVEILATDHYLETWLLKQKRLPSNIAVPVPIQHETMQIQQFLKILPPTSRRGG